AAGQRRDVDDVAAHVRDGEGTVDRDDEREHRRAGGVVEPVGGPEGELMEVGEIRGFEAQGASFAGVE
ncbi:hypothetical protein, partial [Tsukamurella tyrosinosolvens]|uniref:hypothetical protein n=1 Tax=Tsukamurella tyrosinosolvens TaxID=57704 RepID=UPI001C69DC4E